MCAACACCPMMVTFIIVRGVKVNLTWLCVLPAPVKFRPATTIAGFLSLLSSVCTPAVPRVLYVLDKRPLPTTHQSLCAHLHTTAGYYVQLSLVSSE